VSLQAITWLRLAIHEHEGDRARYGDDWPAEPITDEAVLGHLIQEWAFEKVGAAHDGSHIVAVFAAALRAANENVFADEVQHNWEQREQLREE
jgi:hypothetical protein